MKKFSFTGLIKKLSEAVIRFPFVIAVLIGLVTLFFLEINDAAVKLKTSYWIFFSLSIILQLAVTLWFENIKQLWLRYIPNVLAIGIMFLYVYLLPEKLLPYQEPQQFILGMLLIFSCFFVAYLKKNQDDAFWVFSKKTIIQGVISYVFAGILMGGLSLAAFSLERLFGINISEKVYENLSVSCFLIFAPLYFLSNIPGKDDKFNTEFDFNKVLKILGLYILLPVLLLYTIILYVYLIKIVFVWELPEGWVSTLVSVLALAGFLCMLIVYPLSKTEQNKVVAFLSRFFPLILLPLLILMSVGILRRVEDYGFTINRLYVLILNVWFYVISIYLFATKSRHLKWIVITLVLTGLVFSVGPLSVYKINERMMKSELNQLLTEAGVIKNQVFDINVDSIQMDSVKQSRTYELISYVRLNYTNDFFRKHFEKNITNASISKLQQKFYTGIFIKDEEDNNHYKGLSHDENIIPVQQYRFMLEINGIRKQDDFVVDENIRVQWNENALTYINANKKEIISTQSLMKHFAVFPNDVPYSLEDATIQKDGFKLIVKKINFIQYNKKVKNFKLTYFEGFLLIK